MAGSGFLDDADSDDIAGIPPGDGPAADIQEGTREWKAC